MRKRPSLKTEFEADAGSRPTTLRPAAEPAPVAADIAPPVSTSETAPAAQAEAKARQGKKMIGGYFSPECARAVKMLAVERGVSLQHIIGEGLDPVLRQNGKRPFAER